VGGRTKRGGGGGKQEKGSFIGQPVGARRLARRPKEGRTRKEVWEEGGKKRSLREKEKPRDTGRGRRGKNANKTGKTCSV